MTTPNNDNTEAGLLVRLIVLEKQLENLEKAHIKATESISDLIEKTNNIKYNYQRSDVSKGTVAIIEKDLKTLEEKVANIRIDITEISFFKKIGWLVISFIIISVLGFILNTSVFNKKISNEQISSEEIGKKLDDISDKLSKEYNK